MADRLARAATVVAALVAAEMEGMTQVAAMTVAGGAGAAMRGTVHHRLRSLPATPPAAAAGRRSAHYPAGLGGQSDGDDRRGALW